MEGVLNGYVTNPNPTPTLTPNPNRNPNSNPNQINEKIQEETTLEIDQITKCQFGRWKLVKTLLSADRCVMRKWTGTSMLFTRIRVGAQSRSPSMPVRRLRVGIALGKSN